MRKNLVKEKLKAGQPVVGAFIPFASPEMVEFCKYAGFDHVIIDCEHGPMNEETSQHMVRAANAAGITAITRVPQNVGQVILKYIDVGPAGIHIPVINTVEEAKAAVSFTQYGPSGRRGLAGTRALDYGMDVPIPDAVKVADDDFLLICHIENRQALENLPEMVKVDGVDVFFLGTSDMSNSLGVPGQGNHPSVKEAVDYALGIILGAGKTAGIITRTPDEAKTYIERGVRYIATGAAPIFVKGAKEFMATARSAAV